MISHVKGGKHVLQNGGRSTKILENLVPQDLEGRKMVFRQILKYQTLNLVGNVQFIKAR